MGLMGEGPNMLKILPMVSSNSSSQIDCHFITSNSNFEKLLLDCTIRFVFFAQTLSEFNEKKIVMQGYLS
jgi:hypothetical protein